jgi:hypothetical protein
VVAVAAGADGVVVADSVAAADAVAADAEDAAAGRKA